MASSLRNVLRKSPSTRLISTLHNPNPTPFSILHHQTPLAALNPNQEEKIPNFFSPYFGTIKAENFTHSESSVFYPSFPFRLISDPIRFTGSIQSELDDNVSGDSGTIWADSVKKKRKKKMNKHKYKKLRKRLRRKT